MMKEALSAIGGVLAVGAVLIGVNAATSAGSDPGALASPSASALVSESPRPDAPAVDEPSPFVSLAPEPVPEPVVSPPPAAPPAQPEPEPLPSVIPGD